MIPAIFIVATKSLMFFSPYVKTCEKCPIESICWKPKLLEKRIPLEDVECFIDMGASQLFAILLKQEVREFLVLSGQKSRLKTLRITERGLKKLIRSTLLELNPNVKVKIDPIFESTLLSGNVESVERQIVGVTEKSPKCEINVLLENPRLLCVYDDELKFYDLVLKEWKWVPEIEQKAIESITSIVARDIQKRAEEEKEVDFMMKKMNLEYKEKNRQ